jgi:phage terminase large subunit-like protein
LAAPVLAALRARYGGTRLGRQELNAEPLEDTAGALWTREWLDAGCLRKSRT